MKTFATLPVPVQGLQTTVDAVNCPQGFSPDLLNVIRAGGSVEKRKGYVKVNSSAISGTPTILSGIHYQQSGSGGVDKVIVHASDGKLYRLEGAGTWTELKGGFSTTQAASMVIFLNTLIIADGEHDVWSYDGTVFERVTQAPRVRYLAVYNDHLFGAWVDDGGTGRSLVYNSNLRDHMSWSAANVHQIETNDGTEIRGIGVQDRFLWIFKDTKRVALVGTFFEQTDQDFNAQQLEPVPGYGCVSHRSIINVRGWMYFADETGWLRQGGGSVEEVTRNVRATWARVNIRQGDRMWAIHLPKLRQVWMAVALDGSNANTHVLVHDYDNDSVWLWNIAMASLFLKKDVGEDAVPYLGDYAGNVHEGNLGASDNGSAIASYVVTPFFDAGLPDRYKDFEETELVLGNSGSHSLTVEQRVDSNLSDVVSTTVKLMDDSGAASGATLVLNTDIDRIVSISHTGKRVQYKLSNNNANQPWRVSSITPRGEVAGIGR